MKRLLLVLSFLAALIPAAAAAQSAPCQFVLGFQVLHDLDPADIGDCQDNQSFAANGDAVQHTTKGLMAWRKADNWTAYTNGYQSWLNGPSGLVVRLNTQRFAWEADAGTAGTSLVAAAPTPTPIVSAPATSSSDLPPGYTVDPAGRLVTPSGGLSREAPPSSTIPGGATGLCRDGTYSFAAHHQGMCSYHGGVAQFYS